MSSVHSLIETLDSFVHPAVLALRVDTVAHVCLVVKYAQYIDTPTLPFHPAKTVQRQYDAIGARLVTIKPTKKEKLSECVRTVKCDALTV